MILKERESDKREWEKVREREVEQNALLIREMGGWQKGKRKDRQAAQRIPEKENNIQRERYGEIEIETLRERECVKRKKRMRQKVMTEGAKEKKRRTIGFPK